MIATIDNLYALDRKLERATVDEYDTCILILKGNELELLKRLGKDYLNDAEETLAIGQLQNY